MAVKAAISEKAFQRSVIQLAHVCGWKTAHFADSRRQVAPGRFIGDAGAAGWPDLVLCRPPRLIFAELKAENGRLSDDQRSWLAQLLLIDHVETYVWRPANWDQIEQILTGQAA